MICRHGCHHYCCCLYAHARSCTIATTMLCPTSAYHIGRGYTATTIIATIVVDTPTTVLLDPASTCHGGTHSHYLITLLATVAMFYHNSCLDVLCSPALCLLLCPLVLPRPVLVPSPPWAFSGLVCVNKFCLQYPNDIGMNSGRERERVKRKRG